MEKVYINNRLKTLPWGRRRFGRFKTGAMILTAGLYLAGHAAPVRAEASPWPSPNPLILSKKAGINAFTATAFAANPEIREARAAWEGAVEGYRVVSAYPDPRFMTTFFPDPIETRLGPQDFTATLSQNIPFPGKLKKKGDMATAEANIARLNLDRTIRDVMVAVQESFHELWYLRRARAVIAENIKILDQFRTIGESAHAQDRATLMDVVKAQSQEGQVRYDLLLLEELEQTEIARLNSLIDRPPDAAIGRLVERPLPRLAFKLKDIYRLALENREEIRMAKVRVKKKQAGLDLARLKRLPDLTVGLFYSAIGQPDVPNRPSDAGKDAFGVQMGITLPLWAGKNRGRIGQARAEIKGSRANLARQINDIKATIRSVYFRLQNARRLMDLYQNDLLPQAVKAMQTSETWYREGQSSFSDFLETRSVGYNFQLALLRAGADYNKHFARLEGLVGVSLAAGSGKPANGPTKEIP